MAWQLGPLQRAPQVVHEDRAIPALLLRQDLPSVEPRDRLHDKDTRRSRCLMKLPLDAGNFVDQETLFC